MKMDEWIHETLAVMQALLVTSQDTLPPQILAKMQALIATAEEGLEPYKPVEAILTPKSADWRRLPYSIKLVPADSPHTRTYFTATYERTRSDASGIGTEQREGKPVYMDDLHRVEDVYSATIAGQAVLAAKIAPALHEALSVAERAFGGPPD